MVTMNGNSGGQPPTREQVQFELYARREESPIEGHALEGQTDDDAKVYEDEIKLRVQAGDLWAWFVAVVIARYGRHGGMSVCGRCIAQNEADFRDSQEYRDMQRDAYEHLLSRMSEPNNDSAKRG